MPRKLIHLICLATWKDSKYNHWNITKCKTLIWRLDVKFFFNKSVSFYYSLHNNMERVLRWQQNFNPFENIHKWTMRQETKSTNMVELSFSVSKFLKVTDYWWATCAKKIYKHGLISDIQHIKKKDRILFCAFFFSF